MISLSKLIQTRFYHSGLGGKRVHLRVIKTKNFTLWGLATLAVSGQNAIEMVIKQMKGEYMLKKLRGRID